MPVPHLIARFSRLAILMVVILIAASCKDNDGQQAGESAVISQDTKTVQQSRDLAGFPMPTVLKGSERVVGTIGFQSHDPARGAAGSLFLTTADDTLFVTVCNMNINCCTEKIKPSFTVTTEGADVHLYEYLPDVCECFRGLDVNFKIYPALAGGELLQVFANGKPAPVAAGVVE